MLLNAAVQQAAMFGMHLGKSPSIDEQIDCTKYFTFGQTNVQLIELPGHSMGSIGIYHQESAQIIVGDVLFSGSIGRTDLPGGNYNTLIGSIKSKLLTLPENTVVYPGHGPTTTIKKEKHSNPFLV
ncbi:MAG: MBL fold metallo-hydrolase [Bacteroidales bacterium]|nr:MBL fold metallo-hydrolase [Bacteroidales bacterium]